MGLYDDLRKKIDEPGKYLIVNANSPGKWLVADVNTLKSLLDDFDTLYTEGKQKDERIAELREALEKVNYWFDGNRNQAPATWMELGRIVKDALRRNDVA